MLGMDLFGLGGKNLEKNIYNYVLDGVCCGGDNVNFSKDYFIFVVVKLG